VRYFEVPSRRVRSFVGRKEILGRIETIFSVDNHGSQIVVLRAMGGQGKTQIALEICRRMKENCSAIFWIDATSESSILKDFGRVYDRIRNKGCRKLEETDAMAAYVLKSFSDWPHPWLLVFDNYDDPLALNIQDFIPESSQARILITSRHADSLVIQKMR
jgi:hypothetical protein